MDIINFHENRDKPLLVVFVQIPDSPVRRRYNSLADYAFRVTEENKEKNKDTERWDEACKEP